MKFALCQLKNAIAPTGAKRRVGYVVCRSLPYNWVMASTRIRVYDLILSYGGDSEFIVELYVPFRRYDVVVFQKVFDWKARILAAKLRKKGTKILLDLNVNYFDDVSSYIKTEQRRDLERFLDFCDGVICATREVAICARKNTRLPVWVVEESIHQKYFNATKQPRNPPRIFVWSGYSCKAKELYHIKEVLSDMGKKFDFSICVIAEKNPALHIPNVPVRFIKYDEKNIVRLLQKGDVFLAPRDLSDSYNRCHTFTKIGVAMALGIPAVASPVPSYRGSPAMFCTSTKSWKKSLQSLLEGKEDLACLSKSGREFCKRKHGIEAIRPEYDRVFKEVLFQEASG